MFAGARWGGLLGDRGGKVFGGGGGFQKSRKKLMLQGGRRSFGAGVKGGKKGIVVLRRLVSEAL